MGICADSNEHDPEASTGALLALLTQLAPWSDVPVERHRPDRRVRGTARTPTCRGVPSRSGRQQPAAPPPRRPCAARGQSGVAAAPSAPRYARRADDPARAVPRRNCRAIAAWGANPAGAAALARRRPPRAPPAPVDVGIREGRPRAPARRSSPRSFAPPAARKPLGTTSGFHHRADGRPRHPPRGRRALGRPGRRCFKSVRPGPGRA